VGCDAVTTRDYSCLQGAPCADPQSRNHPICLDQPLTWYEHEIIAASISVPPDVEGLDEDELREYMSGYHAY
jgi:hypothetical protein